MELASANLVRAIVAAGYEVRWLAQSDGRLPADLADHCAPIAGTDIVYRYSGVPLPLVAPWAIPKVASQIRASDLVIVVEANFVSSLISFVLARIFGKKTLVIQHVGQPSTVSKLARMLMAFGEIAAARPVIKSADDVVYVSDVVAQNFLGIRVESRSHVVWHGTDTELFRPLNEAEERESVRIDLGLPATGKLACFIGRLTESKGILAVRELARMLPDWHFAIAGIGPIESGDWGLGNVSSLGQLDRGATAKLYRVSDVCILPSQSESFSLVVREALASGTRVVCSEQILETDNRLSELVETAMVNLSDVQGTALHFARVLRNSRQTNPDVGRKYVRDYCSCDKTESRYLQIIDNLVREARLAA